VTSIGDGTFGYCPKLTSIINLSATPQDINHDYSDRCVFGYPVVDYFKNATLYVTCGSKSAYEAAQGWQDFEIIIELGTVTGISLDKTTASLFVNNTKQLTATVEPSDACNSNVSWSSSNEAVATVSNTGLITAVGVGTATITVTTEENGFTAICTAYISLKTGIPQLNAETGAYLYNDRLYVNSPVAETIQVYSVNGVLLCNFQKPAGAADYPLSNAPGSVLIVKGSSGWVKKVIK